MTTFEDYEPDAQPPSLLDRFVRNGADLDGKEFPPMRWAVPGIIPQGMGLVTAPPKAGKSWLTLEIALAVAVGGQALGNVPTGESRPVLLLALEDGEQRLQARCRHLLDGEGIPARLQYVTVIDPGQVVPLIREWLAVYGDQAPLIVLDTLGKVLPASAPGESAYQRDYRVGSVLKRLVDEHVGATLAVVHHTRKLEGADWMDSTSGTNGLNGAADWTLNLSRDRNSDAGTLRVTGRDVIEAEYAITNRDGRWVLDGADLRAAASRAEQVRVTQNLGDDSKRIVEHLNAHQDGQRPSEIALALGLDSGLVRKYLERLLKSGRVSKQTRGLYIPVTTVTSVTFGERTHTESDTSDSSDTPLGSSDSDSTPPATLLDDLKNTPGRCTQCGWHIETQGHRDDCGGAR
jgi:hypothetical protein